MLSAVLEGAPQVSGISERGYENLIKYRVSQNKYTDMVDPSDKNIA